MGDLASRVSHQFVGEFPTGIAEIDGLDNCFDLLTEFLIWNAENGNVGHLCVGDQCVFGFLGINIDAARDDHE